MLVLLQVAWVLWLLGQPLKEGLCSPLLERAWAVKWGVALRLGLFMLSQSPRELGFASERQEISLRTRQGPRLDTWL